VLPALQFAADRRSGVFTGQEAVAAGYTPEQVQLLVRSGRWKWLRRGVYTTAERFALAADPVARHLLDAAAVLAVLDPGAVLSHGTAARAHGFVVPTGLDAEVRLTDTEQWRRGRGYRIARAGLDDEEVGVVAGLPVTAAPRTLVDCAREWSLTAAVSAIDAAIQAGSVTRRQVEGAVLAGSHRVGIGAAGRALHLADGRAQSPLESRGRLTVLAAGLPRPELQVEVYGAAGFVGRLDAWFEQPAVALEFDGQVKYLEPYRGRSPAQVLWDEKCREDALRELGIRVLRVTAEQLDRGPGALGERLRPLFAVQPGHRPYRIVRTPEPGGDSSADAVA
jgi:predicted transcriptional regulator of viral defense system